jgi:hypothetical protein
MQKNEIMTSVIPPIDRDKIKKELSPDKKLRRTNKSDNDIYVVTAQNAPATLLEIGRLRELAFRHYGGGTGKDVDLDEFDTMDGAYQQLIVWSDRDQQILGGYRFLRGADAKFGTDGKPILATAHLFDFSQDFLRNYLPYTVELGRSFVSLDYQVTRGSSRGMFILDNLWDGLGALTVIDPTLRYFYGKVTMYNTYDIQARNMILYFLNYHFPDPDHLVTPIHPLETNINIEQMKKLFPYDNFRDNYKVLNKCVRELGINVPPLVNAYMSLSPKMRVFGTAINTEFGDVEETGILIAISEILEEKRQRHIESYLLDSFR